HATNAGLLDAWDSWSQASSKYTPDCCAAKWQSFNGSAVGLGSLIHWAKEDTGWTPPRHVSPKKNESRWRSNLSVEGNAEIETFDIPPPTDLGNAERFVGQHGQRVRYVVTWKKWLI